MSDDKNMANGRAVPKRRNGFGRRDFLLGGGSALAASAALAGAAHAELKEYPPGTAFPGVIGRTIENSEPAWPSPIRAKPGAPNVLFIVIDDTGFGQLGCFGSPINTPNINKLAQNGLLYTNMHTTALCSPSRSCFLTGRNHHSNSMACITEGATGFPGSNGHVPVANALLSEMLTPFGSATFATGKWHLPPMEEMNLGATRTQWPLRRGFDRFYGFLGAE